MQPPVVPISVWEEMTGSLEFHNYRGRCIYCDMIQQELATDKRIVLDTPNFVVFCPYAARFPFEVGGSGQCAEWCKPGAGAGQHYSTYPNGAGRRAGRDCGGHRFPCRA